MKYTDFKKKIQKFPVFSSSHIPNLTDNEQVLRNQLTRWQKQGLIFRLKRGLYILNEADRKINPSRLFIANELLSPSYISTEYALSFYGLIPEKVEDITSVTTKKTTCFKNVFGTFYYQHLNIPSFLGFKQIRDEAGLPVFIAEPEKALVDFFYLNLSNFHKGDKDVFKDSYRFQNLSDLDIRKLSYFAKTFSSKKLLEVVETFCRFIDSEE